MQVLRTSPNVFPDSGSVCLTQPQTGDFLLPPHQVPFPPKTQKSGFFPTFGKITSDTELLKPGHIPQSLKTLKFPLASVSLLGVYLIPLLLGAQLRVVYRGYKQ